MHAKKQMNGLNFKTKKYTIKRIDTEKKKEMEAVFKLRYDVYCNELNWVSPKKMGEEFDKYDEDGIHFGVFDSSGKLLGTSRIVLPSSRGFMLENEFKDLVSSRKIKEIDMSRTVEISRVALHPSIRGKKEGAHKISEYLYKIMYRWSRLNKKRYWIFVAEKKYFQSLKNSLHIPMNIIGKSKEYTKGVVTLPVMIDLKEARKELMRQLLKFHVRKFSKIFKLLIIYGN